MQQQIYEVELLQLGIGRKLLTAYSAKNIQLTCYSIPDLAYFFDVPEQVIHNTLQSTPLKDYFKANFSPGSLLTYIDDSNSLILPLFKLLDQPDGYLRLVEESLFHALCIFLFDSLQPDAKFCIVGGFIESIINKVHLTSYELYQARSQGRDTSDIIGGGLSLSQWKALNSST